MPVSKEEVEAVFRRLHGRGYTISRFVIDLVLREAAKVREQSKAIGEGKSE